MYLRARRVVMGVDHGPLYHSPFPSLPLYTPSHPPNCVKRWPVRIWIATGNKNGPSRMPIYKYFPKARPLLCGSYCTIGMEASCNVGQNYHASERTRV